MRAVVVAGHAWAVGLDGTLRYTPTASTQWNAIPQLKSPVVAVAPGVLTQSVYVACADGTLHTFSAVTGELQLSSRDPQHDLPVCLLPLALDDALYVGLKDGSIVRLHLSTFEFDCMLGCGVEHRAAVNALEVDDQYLYSAGADAVILVWDLKEGNAVREISMPSAPISSLLRVDIALWVGLQNGVVEVYDIFGDDTNGIECICDKKPHNGPVNALVRIGETEVWSVEGIPADLDLAGRSFPNVAVWNTKDMSYNVSSALDEKDVMSVTVVDRAAFEEVTVLALTNSLGPQLITTNVSGNLPTAPDEEADNMELLITELETQLLQANEEIQRLRSEASNREQRAALESRLSQSQPDSTRLSPAASAHLRCDDTYEDECCVARMQRAFYDVSPEAEEERPAPLVITGSVSESLTLSLNKVSELLVSLLADDVLAPDESVRGNNEDLRRAVANVTRELNVSRQLVERYTVVSEGRDVGRSGSENDVLISSSNHSAESANPIPSSVREELESAIEKRQALEKELLDVTKERDVVSEDLKQLKKQAESTMSSLEEIVRERSKEIKEKDALIVNLRSDCKSLERKYNHEKKLREEREQSVQQELDTLSDAAEVTSRTFEDQLTAAYDKIETKSIEIQSQRDSIRATERTLAVLKTSNQALEERYNELEEQLTLTLGRSEEIRSHFESQNALRKSEHQTALQALQDRHNTQIEVLKKGNAELDRDFKTYMGKMEREMKLAREELETTKADRDKKGQDLERARSDAEISDRDCQVQCSKLKTEVHQLRQQLQSKKEEWGQALSEQEKDSTLRLRTITEEHEAEIQEKNKHLGDLKSLLNTKNSKDGSSSAAIEELHVAVRDLKEERDLLVQELEHRKAAGELYEAETESMRTVINDLRMAAEELQELLDQKEKEGADFEVKVEELTRELRFRESRLDELTEGAESTAVEKGTTLDMTESCKATRAILASATGEIEQMSSQLEAMNRAHAAQEKELNELREALATQNELLRLKNATIEALTEQQNSVEPLSSPGISLNVTPNGSTPVLGHGKENHAVSKYVEEALSHLVSRSAIVSNEDIYVHDTLQELEEGMVTTKDKLRDLTNTARKYKRFAQSHLDVLPALHELEGELVRLTKQDSRKGAQLNSARGIVQSIIAQYYTDSQKKTILRDYDESLYEPSSRRQEALHEAVARMRKLRTGSEDVPFQRVEDVPVNDVPQAISEERGRFTEGAAQSTRRLLTF